LKPSTRLAFERELDANQSGRIAILDAADYDRADPRRVGVILRGNALQRLAGAWRTRPSRKTPARCRLLSQVLPGLCARGKVHHGRNSTPAPLRADAISAA
jgi:hypothetical protein